MPHSAPLRLLPGVPQLLLACSYWAGHWLLVANSMLLLAAVVPTAHIITHVSADCVAKGKLADPLRQLQVHGTNQATLGCTTQPAANAV